MNIEIKLLHLIIKTENKKKTSYQAPTSYFPWYINDIIYYNNSWLYVNILVYY